MMNEVQAVFAIFFAIFLGTVANVQPRWKAFNWPMLCLIPHGKRRIIAQRLLLSFTMLSVAPVAFFAFALWMLIGRETKPTHWTASTVCDVVLHGVVPAFASFSFYRLWLSVIECCPTSFYLPDEGHLPTKLRIKKSDEICHANRPATVEPTIADLHIISRASKANLIIGLVYLIVPSAFLFFSWP